MAIANRILTAAGYIAYPLLLVLLTLYNQQLLLRCIVVPAAGLAICTVLRNTINAPRPYEVANTQPRIPKETHGKSFPSRHTFCMTTIALTWCLWQPIVGAALLVCATIMGALRIYGGVHYMRDVLAAYALACIVCGIGYLAIPW